jgi:orotidine-5'-phosphate decarboxylase
MAAERTSDVTERTAAERLIVALDVERLDQAASLIELLSPHAGWFKVGSVLFTSTGADVCRLVKESGAKLFLDLKFHDIPNTVRGAVRSALRLDVDMLTLHTSGGLAMLEAAVEAREQAGRKETLLVGVTVLTHLSFDDFHSLFAVERPPQDTMVALSGVAARSGIDGVVASAMEATLIKQLHGDEFIVVTPGIRLPEGSKDDQTRVVTPRQAIDRGSDYLVVGRPIIADADPVGACQRFLESMSL